MRTALALLACCFALPATADVYKCRLANGSVEISNQPCAPGSGTVTVRPDEKISESARRDAEREVARMRHLVEQREAAQRASRAAEREEQALARSTPAPAPTLNRYYDSLEECRQEIAQQVLEPEVRQQLEAECPKRVTGNAPPQTVFVPVPVGVATGGLGLCIESVQNMNVSAAEKSRRLRDCDAMHNVPPPYKRPRSEHLPPPSPRPETRPAVPVGSRVICPPADKNCAR